MTRATVTITTGSAAPQRERALRADAVPVLGFVLGVLPETRHGRATPIVALDGSQRPDLRDLHRVLAQEGGTSEIGARVSANVVLPGRGYVTLEVTVRRPVRCAFTVAFDVERDRRLLAKVADSGAIALSFEPRALDPRRYRDTPMLVFPTGDVLADVLETVSSLLELGKGSPWR